MPKIIKTREDHIVFFNLSGSINVNSQNIFKKLIVEDKESARDSILMNFENVSSVSSSGVGILVTACKDVLKQGRIIKFVHISPVVLEKLEFNKVLPVFHIFNDVESAVKQIKLDVERKGEKVVRLFERINIKLGVKFRTHHRKTKGLTMSYQDATAMNLTKRGMFLKTDEVLEPNTLIDVKLFFANGFFKKESVAFLGKVVRMLKATDDKAPGLALVILHMNFKEMLYLDKFLKKQ